MSPDAPGRRWGITVPFGGVPLHEHRAWYELLESLGYTDAWSGESDGLDGFSPLLMAAAWTSSLQVGPAIIPAYTRGPALLAQSAAALAEKVDEDYGTFAVRGFRLSRPVPDPPPLYLAALRSGMLRLAGREADGVIVNWLSAGDVPTVVSEMRAGAGAAADQRLVLARIFVCPNEDAAAVRAIGRRMIAAYLNVEVYAEFHRWLGRAPKLQGMWDAWQAGDRKAALAEISDELVDELVVHGSPAACRERLQEYVTAGINVPIIALIPPYGDLGEAIRGLAPR
jgi:alkanesulfonate monooxygenase SsuD/methylene tetrahydromethanopterin reductase-like flavin-dependent oxidoreductase (luciferase family)